MLRKQLDSFEQKPQSPVVWEKRVMGWDHTETTQDKPQELPKETASSQETGRAYLGILCLIAYFCNLNTLMSLLKLCFGSIFILQVGTNV